ncbi:MAG: SLC13 family permease [Anaerolineae bacterium]
MPLTFEMIAFLTLLILGLVLFTTERFSADVTALGLMLALILLGLLEPAEAFAGFGSETVLMILGLLILTEALVHTGLVDVIGRWLLRFIDDSATRLRGVTLVAPSVMSALMSNTASTAFFLPIILGLARRSGLSASKLLMPLAFASILAGSVTLIGTSTNLVVSGLMQQHGLAPLGFFELTPVGLPIMLVGLAYMATIGQRLIPDRTSQHDDLGGAVDDLYFTEVTIPQGSSLIGKSIDQSGLINPLNLGMLSLQRDDETLKPLADTILQACDTLLVEGTRESILTLPDVIEVQISGTIQQLEDYAHQDAVRTAEVVILPGSPLIGRNIKGLGLRDRYQLQILAVNQAGAIRHAKIGRLRFNIGDVLVIKLPQNNLRLLESDRVFRVLDLVENHRLDLRKVWLASLIFGGSLLLATTGVLSIAVAVLLGALLVFITRCISPEIAYRNIEWKTLILIGSMLAFGQAMQSTGTADYLAQMIAQLPAGFQSPFGLLSLFFLLALFLTQPMSNQAAAAVLIPVAIQTAVLLGYNPRPFAVMIALAASASFITPLEPACVLVYSAGRYRFADFMRVGGLLTVLVYLVAILLVPMFWTV